jgi:hypothetical protein
MIVVESGFIGTAYDLTTPRIAAGALTGTVAVSTEATGYEGVNALTGVTYTAWQPTALPATWTLTFSSAAVSYVGIAAHDLFTQGATVNIQRWTGAAWSTVASNTPADNGPILFLLTRRTAQTTFRVQITGTTVPTVGVIWIGDVLELPVKCAFRDSLPFNEGSEAAYATNISDGGHTLGRYEARVQSTASMTISHISETWAAANIAYLSAWLRAGPVFMADRPLAYPKSVVFGETAAPVRATRAGRVLAAARSLEIELKGYDPV